MNISLIIPCRNNLFYLKFAYFYLRKFLDENNTEVIILSDASTDGTPEFVQNLQKTDHNLRVYINSNPERMGHTVLYDIGIDMAKNDIVGIFHADMVPTPNYLTNAIKHLKPGTVVCSTRIEPPLHPPGPEKIVKNFGMEPWEFEMDSFLNFVENKQREFENVTTRGIFAPWFIYKRDFQKIGGHDKNLFAPMELEDSDLFNRFYLAGYKLIQSRDSFVYHFTCRGSRFKDGIKIEKEIPIDSQNIWLKARDSEEYTSLRKIKFREWWRKWHSDVMHDENMYPIVYPRFNVGFEIYNSNIDALYMLEPWCDKIWVDDESSIKNYISYEQKYTRFNLKNRIFLDEENPTGVDILVKFDWNKFKSNSYNFEIIKNLPILIDDLRKNESVYKNCMFEYGCFYFKIFDIIDYSKYLINSTDSWLLDQLTK